MLLDLGLPDAAGPASADRAARGRGSHADHRAHRVRRLQAGPLGRARRRAGLSGEAPRQRRHALAHRFVFGGAQQFPSRPGARHAPLPGPVQQRAGGAVHRQPGRRAQDRECRLRETAFLPGHAARQGELPRPAVRTRQARAVPRPDREAARGGALGNDDPGLQGRQAQRPHQYRAAVRRVAGIRRLGRLPHRHLDAQADARGARPARGQPAPGAEARSHRPAGRRHRARNQHADAVRGRQPALPQGVVRRARFAARPAGRRRRRTGEQAHRAKRTSNI